MLKPKVGDMKKAKLLAILFSIFLISCFVSTRSFKSPPEPDGFRNIKWGTEISTLKDMEKVKDEKSSESDLVWYTRKGDTLAIGQARLENIFYSFWIGKFYGVWIDFEGDENFGTLKKELFEQFGKVHESKELIKKTDNRVEEEPSAIGHAEQFYAWWGRETEMTLSYSKDRHKGILYINSRMISEERRAYEIQKEKEKRLKER